MFPWMFNKYEWCSEITKAKVDVGKEMYVNDGIQFCLLVIVMIADN